MTDEWQGWARTPTGKWYPITREQLVAEARHADELVEWLARVTRGVECES